MTGNSGNGKQAVHELKSGTEVNEDAGGCEFGSILWQFGSVLYRLYRKGKQVVHEPESEVNEDRGVCVCVCVCVNLGQCYGGNVNVWNGEASSS